MLTIFLQALKNRRTSLLVYLIFGIAFIWMYAALYPSVQAHAAEIAGYVSSFPQEFVKAFGIGEINYSTFEGFLSVEQFNLMWGIVVILMAVSFAGASIAEEIDRGTVDILLAGPVSRWGIFFGKYAAGIFMLLVFTFISIFIIVPLAEIHSLDYEIQNFVKFAVMGFLFGAAIFSFAMLFSAIFSEKGRVYLVAGGTLGIMYLLEIAANLKDKLDVLRYFSFFHYFSNESLIHNTLNSTSVLVFITVAVVCAGLGAVLFFKRDIKST